MTVGPAVAAVSDDPEGAEVFREVVAQRNELSTGARERVHLALLPMDDLDENAAIVNALQRNAEVVVQKSLAEGFGLPVIEAFSFGTPVVHSDAPAVVEVAAGAGLQVEREDADGYPGRLAAAIASVVGDGGLAERLRFQGLDRAGAFSWQDSAQKVWQLHADL